jgi:DNA-3-methyladenine glycosylase I
MDTSIKRCTWCGEDALYIKYHDEEWGVPVHDDQKMFEFLILESFQAGLSWITILRKRENFRKAFDNFDVDKIANYNEQKVESLMQDAGIIRNRLKINAAIKNAKQSIELRKEGGLAKYFWNWVDGKQLQNRIKTISDVPAKTELSDAIAKDLKKRGFSFVGSTTIYAHLQASGLVNDHTHNCFRYKDLE